MSLFSGEYGDFIREALNYRAPRYACGLWLTCDGRMFITKAAAETHAFEISRRGYQA